MESKFRIIQSKGKEHLCHYDGECYFDVSYPMMSFVEGEDDFMVMQPNLNASDKIFRYHEKELRLVPEFYQNG